MSNEQSPKDGLPDAVDAILAQWGRERPDLDVTPMGVLGRLKRISLRLAEEMEKTWQAHGLTRAGFDVLATLRRSGSPYSLSPGVLLESMMITSGTMTHRIDQLVKAGLVTRTPNPEDRRSMQVSLTAEGLAVIDAAVVDHVATQRRLLAALPDNEVAALDRVLRAWMTALDDPR